MSKEKEILDAELLMLKSEVLESKIYIEVGAVTLLFIVSLYINDFAFRSHVATSPLYRYTSMAVLILIMFTIIYLFINIIYTIYTKMKKIKEQEKELLRNWIDDN